MHYNFCRIHKTLRVTPAMAAGVSKNVWEVADIVAIIEATEPAPGCDGYGADDPSVGKKRRRKLIGPPVERRGLV